ncbi:MAG TPA: sialidase family protein [Nitrospira sp.]|nr:sialidase family protein [Nitrospira sp.]
MVDLKSCQKSSLLANPVVVGGWIVLVLMAVFPLTVARAEPPLPYDLGQKVVIDRQAKTLVGPSVQLDDQGHVGLVWVEENKDVRSVLFARAIAPGGPIGTPVSINRPEETPYWRQEAPVLVMQGDDAFVSWGLTHPKSTPQQPLATELRLSRSTDGGRTFHPSVLVNDDQGVIQHTFDALHRDAEGRLHLSWIDGRDGKKEPGTYVARSLDKGQTVTHNMKVDESTCVCCRTAITSGPDGMIYVAWRKIFEGNVRETVVARSTDGGSTFEAPVIVGHDQWVFPACPHRPASMSVDRQGRLYVVWYTEGTDETPAVYLAFSDDQGRSFSEKRKLNVARNTFPDHPQIAVDQQGRIVVIWEEQAPVKRDVVISVSTDRGATFSVPQKVNDKKSQTPAVAVNAQGLFVLAWMEHGMPGHKIVTQTLRMPSAHVAEVER